MQRSKQTVTFKMFTFVKQGSGKHEGLLMHLNPIALRKAKIAYSFGLSECNRVNYLPFKLTNQSETLCQHCSS